MEFKKVKLGEVLESVFSGGTPSTKIQEYWNGNIRWLSSGETSNDFINDTNSRITDIGVKKSSTKLAIKNDLVMASAGQGKTRGQISYLNIDTYINQSVIAIRSNKKLLNNKYLYYNLKSRYIELRSLSDSASTRGSITTKMIKDLDIFIPPLLEQRKISKLLFTLDSKIEINNKIISNLESQAQAIFKSWFVDFEPFQDGDFVESELGMIPEGWEVKELGEVADFSNGYSFKSKDLLEEKKSKNDYKVFKQADIKVGGGINPNNTKSWIDSEFIRKNKLSRFIIQSGDLMMCMTDMKNNVRLLGNTALVYQPDEYILNQRVGRLRSKQKEIKPSFLYYLTNNSVFLNDLRGRANTGVQVNLSTSEIKRSKVILPTCDIIKRFCDYSESITKSINSLNNQNTKLAELRDALLPKLMAGEIDVSNIKIEGEEVKNE